MARSGVPKIYRISRPGGQSGYLNFLRKNLLTGRPGNSVYFGNAVPSQKKFRSQKKQKEGNEKRRKREKRKERRKGVKRKERRKREKRKERRKKHL